jgi:hypothetical protein
MAVKKSDLYSSLWASCDELRGGMDASQYKDYVLFMLFIKYVSDKYGDYDGFEPPVVIPKGASFKDMVALKGNSDIGNLINTQVIQPLIDANTRLARSDFPDFNDSNKLGDGAQKVEKLGNLIAIFENPALDFSQNRAENDDILGDAYEYLMRHFATESGKSKGQFYTPSEVSRIMAKDFKEPAVLHGKPEAIVLFNNLPEILAKGAAWKLAEPPPDEVERRAALALNLDRAMREHAPAGWKGDEIREKQVLNALFPIMSRDRDATRAIFEIIKHQPGY